MSKMKHLLRKLYIGDHQQHGRPLPPALDPSPPPQTTSSQPSNTSSSPSSDLPQPGWSSENENWNNNFNFLEEEFQMQLALAISVSDPVQNRVDSETAQIDAAKQISLGCSVSQSLPDFLSFRYWSSNVVNYDEKVMDGFYDVCGIDSNLAIQPNMPSLVDLGEISVTDDIGREVIIVDRAVDVELRKLEERVYFLSMEYRALGKGVNTTPLVQKIADLIVERMGGPVSDVEEMFWRWRARNHELRIYLNTIIHPLGSLDVGHSRQRALLFKVLADKINLPCKLVKGSYYTGTDEGAVNLIKLDDGSEYIIDLMGAPGTLIPAELPSYHQQSFGLDPWSIGTFAGFDRSSSISEHGVRIRSIPSFDGKTNTRNFGSESSSTPIKPNGKDRKIAHNILTEQLIHDTTTVKGPELSREHSIMLSTMEDLLPDISSHYLREDKFLEKDRFLHRESVFDQNHPEISSSKDERSLVTFTALQSNNFTCSSNPKKSAEGLGAPQFKMEAAGYNSSLSPSNQQNVHFEDKIDEAVISNEDGAVGRELVYCGNREAMEIGCSNQLIGNNDDRVQIEPVVNGVAEILWEDLWIGERVGIGSYGEVYRAEWNGTEVAVKKFMKQDISGDALAQFKCEIEIMLRLRHPNVVLLMGAVTQPPNMSILTEFLPRGSLYKLLHRTDIQINEDRRIKMALDVAKGMNYLHTSHPIIVHRDLKSPNLLVDRNWVVKVCDFGMSRLQHHTFLSSKSAAGTAEWMAPEVLRSEISNEKSDVYSFGVILWELATLRVPWTEMNSMQVVGAVGFQGRHLDIPPMVDPLVAGIISDCWNRSPQARPSFAQIIGRLKNLQRLSVRGIKGRKSTLMM